MSVPEVRPDASRGERVGLDEAIFCAGKSAGQIEVILAEARKRGARLLLTRLGAEQLHALSDNARAALAYDALSRTAFFGAAHASKGEPRVVILSAGTSDLPAAREAERTLAWYGEAAAEFHDVGVAGLWRLTERLEEIRRFPVLIVAAGMDAALLSVVGGLVRGCVIGLPTSVGYGVASGGRTALDAMLASCAPGLAVVNIDNGYGAACTALRMLRAFAPPA
ncbi:MAG: circadian phase modifier CpmA [Betaproteobacteria bacterium RIFCSPLOWO2_12_FULL_64_23]|nr:MAG: circadian phase modifier CpmA [Betaproteobacteria bacterium RIFCSPLOWO2_12_FULL_64_23]